MYYHDDKQKQTIFQKIALSAEAYKTKTGSLPEVIFINRKEAGDIEKDQRKELDSLPYLVKPFSIPPFHFWACVDNMEKELAQEKTNAEQT